MSKKYECLVCGRIFPEGQGIKLSLAGKDVYFHSKRCALKFFKSLILYIDQKILEQAIRLAIREFEERLREVHEKTKKSLEKI